MLLYVAAILAKKDKKNQQKKSLLEEFKAKFYQKWTKRDVRKVWKEVPYLRVVYWPGNNFGTWQHRTHKKDDIKKTLFPHIFVTFFCRSSNQYRYQIKSYKNSKICINLFINIYHYRPYFHSSSNIDPCWKVYRYRRIVSCTGGIGLPTSRPWTILSETAKTKNEIHNPCSIVIHVLRS